MPRFKCVKPTTFRGRMVLAGAGVKVNDKVAASFKKHPCWEVDKPVKKTEAVADAPVSNAKPEAGTLEAQRQQLLKTAKGLGLKPRANTGHVKLEDMIREAKKVKPDDNAGGSII